VLFLYGTLDGTCPEAFVTRMPKFIQDLKVVAIQDRGHWLLVEAAERVNAEVLAFLDMKGGDGPRAESIAPARL
jgi:soluble epoxide hydrolase / lipid-phosphate phosphatase